MKRVAIIGGGLAGVAAFNFLILNFVKHKKQNSEIYLFEPKSVIGPGLPYDIQQPFYFLNNHEANNVGGVPDVKKYCIDSNYAAKFDNKPDMDFYYWVQENWDMGLQLNQYYPKEDLEKISFNYQDEKGHGPRSLYGRYLQHRFESARAFAEEKGVPVHIIHRKVDNIEQKKDRTFLSWSITKPHIVAKAFDDVILALGHWSEKSRAFDQRLPHYFPHVYPAVYGEKIKNNSTVFIKGAGLSANDAALSFLLSREDCQVIMGSRTGVIRKTRAPVKPYKLQKVSWVELLKQTYKNSRFDIHWDDIKELYLKELLQHYPKNPENLPIKERLEYTIKEHEEAVRTGNDAKWRSIQNAVVKWMQDYYPLFPEHVKKEFIQDATFFFSRQAPMPLVTAKILLDALEKGKLQIIEGIGEPKWNSEKQQYTIVIQGKEIQAGYIIDARNYQAREACDHPLISKIISNGIVERDEKGGIYTNPKTRKVMLNSEDLANIYAIGLGFGNQVLPANSVRSVEDAKCITEDILKKMIIQKYTHRENITLDKSPAIAV